MRLFYFVLGAGAFAFFSFKELYDNPDKNPILPLIFSIICCGLFVFFLAKLIRREAELILTNEGVEIYDDAFYNWNMVTGFETWQTKYKRPPTQYLVFHFKEFSDIEIDITEWELRKDEVVDYILSFKGAGPLFYHGHSSR